MCISPLTIKQTSGELKIFECGKCFECIRKRKLHWTIRLHSEMTSSDVAFFSLISYNPENYPDPDNYDIPAIQRLLKSLRSRINRNFSDFAIDKNKPIKLRYFIVSEYGELRSRLHYHAIFFLSNINCYLATRFWWKELLEDTWSKGFCSAFPLDERTITYTCKYIQKQYNMMLYSKSLGKFAFEKHYDLPEDYELPTYVLKGKHHVVPRSWRLELTGDLYNTIAVQKMIDEHKDDIPRLSIRDRIAINDSFFFDEPIKDRTFNFKQSNDDIIPNGEF